MRVNITYTGSLSDIAAGIEAAVAEAVAAGAETAADNARGVCPVDTGTLRDSIAVTQSGTSAQISANTDYAAYVEFGTSKMAAQPYLVPSLLGNENAIISAIAASLGGAI